MLVYVIMLLLSTGIAYVSMVSPRKISVGLTKHSKQLNINVACILAIFSALPLLVVSAFRYKVGVDYESYVWIFQYIEQGKSVYTEQLYQLLNKSVSLIGGTQYHVFAIASAITLGLIFNTIFKHSINPSMSIFLFVAMGYLFSSFNILRQYISIAIIFFAVRFIFDNKFLPFLALVMIAILFHKTAVVMIPLFFILRLRLPHSYMLMLGGVGMGVSVFRNYIIDKLVLVFYPQYYGTDLIQPLSIYEMVYYLVVLGGLAIICYLCKEKYFTSDKNLILYNALMLSLLCYTCFYFVPEINRIVIYFELFVIILIPELLNSVDKRYKLILNILIVLFFLLFMIVSIGLVGRFDVLPYRTFIP